MRQRWFSGPEARFAQDMQKRLLLHALAAWPRRGTSLVEIDCGRGNFLPLFWQCGFDLTATEHEAEARATAQARAPKGVEVVAAATDHLPFADRHFDWAVLHLEKPGPDIMPTLQEAHRVAARGLAVTFWNRASLPALLRCLSLRTMPWPARPMSWWYVWQRLQRLEAFARSIHATLTGPLGSWNRQCPLAACNGWLARLPLGAWCIIRLDLAPLPGRRGLPLRLRQEALRKPEPVMEFGNTPDTVNPRRSSL